MSAPAPASVPGWSPSQADRRIQALERDRTCAWSILDTMEMLNCLQHVQHVLLNT
ncbi:hypothetical protein PHYPO_G00077060 [Pangasianodon hypophthalmus]|uniref:Uncharacterized protein n=1 Tax=Pangasianodon hypophthalmus TaxID=310915 RepID=A0A5N5LKX6_PANHP|nr:hypothetical protein PHYPO_G00077060 [Pangasianodon hypophthalmus]